MTFEFPTRIVLKTTFFPMCLLFYCTFFPKDSTGALFAPARFIYQYVQGTILSSIWIIVFVLHVGEALYTLKLARKHAGTFNTGVRRFICMIPYTGPNSSTARLDTY
jgi:hypothetical protein